MDMEIIILSDRDRQISYDITYMQNLKKILQMNLLQNINTDSENEFMVTGVGGGGVDWEFGIDM